MQTTFLKKIYLLLFIFISYLPSYAQIVYTNVIPDQIFNTDGAVYHLDMNNDSITDFNITYSVRYPGACSDIAQLNYFIRISPVASNYVADDTINPLEPLCVDYNTTIDKSMLWKYQKNQTLFSMTWLCMSEYWVGTASGYWINTSNKYLPLKLKIGNNKYFGWLAMDITGLNSSFGNFKIKEYAINSIPNQPILAGEIACTAPLVNVTANGPLSFCFGDSVILSANANAYQYQWKRNGVNISGATSSTYTARIPGTYKVKAINSCGNAVSGNVIVTNPCRQYENTLSNEDQLEHLTVRPNPAINIVTVHLPSDDDSFLQIVDLFGNTVFSGKAKSDEMIIDLSNFNAGVYLIKWSNSESSETKTFSVIK